MGRLAVIGTDFWTWDAKLVPWTPPRIAPKGYPTVAKLVEPHPEENREEVDACGGSPSWHVSIGSVNVDELTNRLAANQNCLAMEKSMPFGGNNGDHAREGANGITYARIFCLQRKANNVRPPGLQTVPPQHPPHPSMLFDSKVAFMLHSGVPWRRQGHFNRPTGRPNISRPMPPMTRDVLPEYPGRSVRVTWSSTEPTTVITTARLDSFVSLHKSPHSLAYESRRALLPPPPASRHTAYSARRVGSQNTKSNTASIVLFEC
ncbi:hypothetical protein BD779DRAFT_1475891 [Infundibulicybe gibba]|nr:hypothetical protein BD779DRAFT_1475891 [Infundibulicybe gibba]